MPLNSKMEGAHASPALAAEEAGFDSELEQIRNKVKRYCKEQEMLAVEKAFHYADERLHGLRLSSGKPLFRHNIQTAKILADLRLDSAIVVAALVHNLLSLGVSEKDIEGQFGSDVRQLITNRNRLKVGFSNEIAGKTSRDEVFLTMARDIRAVVLELAEKLETIAHPADLPQSMQERVFRMTKEIYIPLANKLGMYRIKASFEDLLMKHTMPEQYAEIVSKIAKMKKKREKKIEKVKVGIKAKLNELGIDAEVMGRTKHIYGIYDKMQRTGRGFEEIYDLSGVRVITDTASHCYEILGAVHSMWKPLPGEFDDYIAKPKPNQYRSLHTTAIGPDRKPLEIQIRTREMHNVAEYGAAAHWAYKANEPSTALQDLRTGWLKQVLEWKQEAKTQTFIDSLKVDFFGNDIFVLTPKGEVIELPRGATVIDFAYAVHTEIGNRCARAKVNGKVVPISTKLENADAVEIITSDRQRPRRHWLSIAKTDKAGAKIRQVLGITAPTARRAVAPSVAGSVIKITDKKARIAKCCSPVLGDDVIGIATTKRKVSVHRRGCKEVEKINSKKTIGVEWDKGLGGKYLVMLKVVANERPGLLSEVLGAISKSGFYINSTNAKMPKQGIMECLFEVKVGSIKDLEALSGSISGVSGINSIVRV